MRRRRVRTWAKWAATLAAALAVGVAVASGFCGLYATLAPPSEFPCWHVTVSEGLFRLHRENSPELNYENRIVTDWFFDSHTGWSWGLRLNDDEFGNAAWHGGVLFSVYSDGWLAGMSLAYPVLLTMGVAAFLWYKDRRPPRPDACGGCGYDKSGLDPNAKCPECGTVPAPRAQS
jgi:hypothetical protein